jgi:hypothetical protein
LRPTFSITVIGMRCDTPERLSMRLSLRASNATRSTTSAHDLGHAHRLARPPPSVRAVHASCCVMLIPSSTLSG